MADSRRICAHCGELKAMQPVQVTCSLACRTAYARQVKDMQAPVAVCSGCNERKILSYRAAGLRVCSGVCKKRVDMRVRRAQRGQPAFVPGRTPKSKVCDWCGEVYAPRRYDQRFCGRICSERNRYLMHRGEEQKAQRRTRRLARDASIEACALCGTTNAQVLDRSAFSDNAHGGRFHHDHVIPRSQGGKDHAENRRWLCWFCNFARNDMHTCHDDLVAAAGRAFWQTHHAKIACY